MLNKVIILITLFLLITTTIVSSQQALLNETSIVSDTYVDQGLPNTNFGTSTTMAVESGDGAGANRISIITWNLTSVLPFNATNITAFMNLTEENPTSSIDLRIINATNTTWNETGITFNTFFCTTNANGTINLSSPSQCSTEISITTTTGVNNAMDQFNVTGTINVNSTFVTYVMDSQTGAGTQGMFNTKEGIFSEAPTLELMWDEINITPPPPPVPPPIFNETDRIDLTSCGITSSDMVLNPNGNILYVNMRTVGGTTRIAIVNITDITNMVLQNCVVAQIVAGSALSIQYMEGVPDVSPVEGFLASVNSAGTTSINLFNVTNGGATITATFNIASPGSQAFGLSRPFLDGGNLEFLNCQAPAAGNINTYLTETRTGLTVFQDTNIVGAAQCSGLSLPNTPFGVGGNTFHMMSDSINGQYLIKDADFIQSDLTIIVSAQPTDSVRFNNNFYSISGNVIQLYEFVLATQSINARGAFTPADAAFDYGGTEFVGTNFIVGFLGDGAFNSTLAEYNSTNKDSITQNLNETLFNLSVSASVNDLEYMFPRLFVKDGDTLVAFFYTPTDFNVSNAIKPRVTNVQAGTTTTTINQSTIVTWTVQNPETALVGEPVLTTLTCDYREFIFQDEQFAENFNFSAVCNSFNIGTINGFNFGLGLNLATCDNDFLLLPTNIANETITSFDIFVPTGEEATREIQLISFGGSEIATLNITVDTLGFMTVRQKDTGIVMLRNIPIRQLLTNVPTRIFLQFNPITTNSQTSGLMFISTNVYALNDVNSIDVTFCDNNELCFIGENSIQVNPFNNYFGLFLTDEGSGTMVLDNFKTRTINQYPNYRSEATNTFSDVCSFETLGPHTTRVYASDELFGSNYLAFQNINIETTSTGLPVGLPGTVTENATLAQIITDVAGVAGFGDTASRVIISLIILMSFVFGAFRLTENVAAGLFTGSVLGIFFFFLGWLPLIVMVLIVLLVAGLMAVFFRSMFFGGGGG